MLLVTSNTQSELTPIERGIHALRATVKNRETPLLTGWTIEPYRAGAVVTGKLSGGIIEDQQITFFCRSNLPGKVLMLVSWHHAWASPSRAADDNNSIRTAIWEVSVAVGGKVVRRSSGYDSIAAAHVDNTDRWFITYILTADEFVAGLKSGRLEIAADGPNSLGLYASRVSPPTIDLGRAARIAFNPDDLDPYRLAAQTQVIGVVAMVTAKVGGRGAARA
jgi:hypothetical protein